MAPALDAMPSVQKDGLMRFGSRGAATKLALATFADAFAGTDPTSLHFAKSSTAAQRAFWLHYIGPHILDSEPRLNFLAKGGGGAIVANLLPAQESGWLGAVWQGLRLLLAAVPRSKWREAAAYGDYLKAKQHEFQKAHGPFLLITLVGVQPALQCQGIGSVLLRRVLRYADEHSLPSYLEASTERSRRLYLRHGFRDLETWHGAFPVFLMWRPAGGAPAAAAPAADANFSRPAAAATPGNSAASQQQDPAAAAAEAKAVAGDAGAAGAGGTAESEPGMIAGDSSRQQNEIGGGGSGSAPSMGSRHPPKSVSNGIVL